MKRGPLLNSGISSVVSRMGHGDSLVIADAGLPIPLGTERLDIALTPGIPSFAETLRVLLEELVVERLVIAEEIKDVNPVQLKRIVELLGSYRDRRGTAVDLVFVSHADFKARTSRALAVVRTGECSAYSNAILESGVDFP